MWNHQDFYRHVKEAVFASLDDYEDSIQKPHAWAYQERVGQDKARKAIIKVITQMAEDAIGRYDGRITPTGRSRYGPAQQPATATGAASSSAGVSIPTGVPVFNIGDSVDVDTY